MKFVYFDRFRSYTVLCIKWTSWQNKFGQKNCIYVMCRLWGPYSEKLLPRSWKSAFSSVRLEFLGVDTKKSVETTISMGHYLNMQMSTRSDVNKSICRRQTNWYRFSQTLPESLIRLFFERFSINTRRGGTCTCNRVKTGWKSEGAWLWKLNTKSRPLFEMFTRRSSKLTGD